MGREMQEMLYDRDALGAREGISSGYSAQGRWAS